ncbi:DUF6335 family protein [Halomicronema sp. CCY15110]|uniref:DUF6335 family protein n=1 Tax=Halomicronema sp. CCY15110 TaxID=2767773 RepID=UPI00194F0DAA|nr:DUF6335 family protein [Halomicronema sp. CCY15110]
MHSNAHQSAESLVDDNSDLTPPPGPPERSPQQAAVEAARTGREDQSHQIGAERSLDQRMAAGKPTTQGDPDAMTEQAKVVGEEAVGGTTPTPDQSNVDDIAASAGINTQAEHPVRVLREMQRRDEHRFELDPESKGPAASA